MTNLTEIQRLSLDLHEAREMVASLRAGSAGLRIAVNDAICLLGPTAPECCGCEHEWNAAIKTLRAALSGESNG